MGKSGGMRPAILSSGSEMNREIEDIFNSSVGWHKTDREETLPFNQLLLPLVQGNRKLTEG